MKKDEGYQVIAELHISDDGRGVKKSLRFLLDRTLDHVGVVRFNKYFIQYWDFACKDARAKVYIIDENKDADIVWKEYLKNSKKLFKYNSLDMVIKNKTPTSTWLHGKLTW